MSALLLLNVYNLVLYNRCYCCMSKVVCREETKKFIANVFGDVIPNLKKLETSPYDKSIERKYLQIDVCPRGCMAFAGYDVSNLARCRKCQAPRFKKCSYISCRYKTYDECPHVDFQRRIANMNLFYRPLLPLLVELLQTKYFFDYCCHALAFVQKYPWHEGDDYLYNDILSGKQCQQQVLEMHDTFRRFKESEAAAQHQSIKEVSLVAADYYDGVPLNIRAKKAQNFWPLFVSFITLPISVRGKFGLGSFFWGFLSSKPGSLVEDFLFRDCVVAELKLLAKGYLIQIGDQHFFIQLRLVIHVYDTKAKEKIERFLGTNSLSGCIKCMLHPGL